MYLTTTLALTTLLTLTNSNPLHPRTCDATAPSSGCGLATTSPYNTLATNTGNPGACNIAFADLVLPHIFSLSGNIGGANTNPPACGTCVQLCIDGTGKCDNFLIADGKTDMRGPDIDSENPIGLTDGDGPVQASWTEVDQSLCKGFWNGKMVPNNFAVGKLKALQDLIGGA